MYKLTVAWLVLRRGVGWGLFEIRIIKKKKKKMNVVIFNEYDVCKKYFRQVIIVYVLKNVITRTRFAWFQSQSVQNIFWICKYMFVNWQHRQTI